MFEALGLVLALLSWVAGAYLIRTWRGTYAMSISQHAASAREAYRLFATVLVLGGGACYIWLVGWFAPHLQLGAAFTIILTVTVLAQFIVAIVPDTNEWRHKLHHSVALSMAALYLPLTYLIVSADRLSHAAQIVSAACIVYMLFAGFLFFFVKWARNYYLIFQSLYIVAFQLIILAAAYL